MTPPVFLDAGDVTLHPVEDDDLSFCHRLVNDQRVRQGLTIYRPKSLEEEREFVDSLDDDLRLIARADGERVGVVDLVGVDGTFGTAELGYFFDPAHWGEGYATAAAGRVIEYGFAERRLHRIHARVLDPNEGSKRVLEKLGFEHEGRLREHAFVDGEHVAVDRYGLLADEWDGADAQ